MGTSQGNKGVEYSPYRWAILAITGLCFLITFITRFTWPPLIPEAAPQLGMEMTQAGAFMSAFYIGYVITQVPAGALVDKFGVRVILSVSLLLEGVATFFMGSITGFQPGFVLRLITGIGAGAVMSCCSRAIMDWFPAKERGTAFGLLLAAPSAGIVLSNYIVPVLNNAFGGWQGVFRTIGIVTIICGFAVFAMIKTTKQVQGKNNILLGFKTVLTNKNLLLTGLAGFCLMWVELCTATWANTYIKQELGYSVATAGIVMVFYGIGGVISPMISGYISDKTGKLKGILMAAYALSIPVTLLFGYQTSIAALCAVGFLFGFICYIANPLLNVMVNEFAGKELAGTATGTTNFMYQMASIIGPAVIGFSIDFSGNFSSVWWIMAIGPLVGLLLLIPVKRNVAEETEKV